MNIARMVEIDGAPMLLIYAKKHGTHQHSDIEGITCLETGLCTSARYEGEAVPRMAEDISVWLINKTQNVIGDPIEARPWDAGSIDITHVFTDHPKVPLTSATA